MIELFGLFLGIGICVVLFIAFFPIFMGLVFIVFIWYLWKTKIGNPLYHDVMRARKETKHQGGSNPIFFTWEEQNYMWGLTDKYNTVKNFFIRS